VPIKSLINLNHKIMKIGIPREIKKQEHRLLTSRITSLERVLMYQHADFQPESAAFVKDAGYNGVLVNGFFGASSLRIESLVESRIIPDLMPLTIKANRREMMRRCEILQQAGIRPWLCQWGGMGPDESKSGMLRWIDNRSKLEMHAKMARTPEIFGHQDPAGLNWFGGRPLCISHPLVRRFYSDLMGDILKSYPDIEGMIFVPGDIRWEFCDEYCPRCKASGLDQIERVIRYANEIYESSVRAKPGFQFQFVLWNAWEGTRGDEHIERVLKALHPDMGIGMAITDISYEQGRAGRMVYNQPWMTYVKPGGQFLKAVDFARNQGRAVMVMGEISQSEVWSPVCHNMPNPHKVLDFLRNCAAIDGVSSIFDFWGNRRPYLPHANHAVLRVFLEQASVDREQLLRQAALAHYQLPETEQTLVDRALGCWLSIDRAVDARALVDWGQRFSPGIGHDGARGGFYRALVPPNLRAAEGWVQRQSERQGMDAATFAGYQQEDCTTFLAVAAEFEQFANILENKRLVAGAASARREGLTVALAGELIASQGRTAAAAAAFQSRDVASLRRLVEAEIDARERQMGLSGRLGWGAGVDPFLVEEDIQNMRLYLSSDDFPDTPDACFHFSTALFGN
jgi:hypothetical protein